MTAPILCKHVREVDRIAIEELGMPGLVLMENAGRGVSERVRQLAPSRVVIACGGGNNGGDGFVIARHLDLFGLQVQVVLCAEPERLKGDAAANFGWLRETRVQVLNGMQNDWAKDALDHESPPLIIDAMLGTGATGEPREPFDRVIEKLNSAEAVRRVAVDIPSGLDADTGVAADATFRADETLTFVAPKAGLLQAAAQPYVGELRVIGIGVPRKLLERLGMPVERPRP